LGLAAALRTAFFGAARFPACLTGLATLRRGAFRAAFFLATFRAPAFLVFRVSFPRLVFVRLALRAFFFFAMTLPHVEICQRIDVSLRRSCADDPVHYVFLVAQRAEHGPRQWRDYAQEASGSQRPRGEEFLPAGSGWSSERSDKLLNSGAECRTEVARHRPVTAHGNSGGAQNNGCRKPTGDQP
jgi:hypothetical protein